ncbi:MAG: GNAT family N-acetyltransferase [Bradymonadia bacterium]
MNIREYRPTDLTAILRLWRALMDHHRPIHHALYRVHGTAMETYERWLLRRIKEDQAQVWIADIDGQVVGYVMTMMGYRSPVYSVNNVGMICDLIVDSNTRRMGVGRTLVSHAVLAMLSKGVETVQVNYDHQNEEAVAFWSAMGFAPRLIEAYRHLSASDMLAANTMES